MDYFLKSPITYEPKFIKDPTKAFNSLFNDLEWEKRDAPRQEYYCNDFPKDYVYGVGKGERLYQPRPWHPAILEMRRDLEEIVKCKFEVCFLNLYLNQLDKLGWHSDDSPEMDDNRDIAIISLGVEREIWFRPKENPKPEDTERLTLGNGSLCLMHPGMQDAWQHRIPKASFKCGERISLTFRGYIEV